jgi:hypothetical protein
MGWRNICPFLEKNMKLYVNGCSFAYGIGIERYNPGKMQEVYSKCEAKRFSKQLADAWDMEEMNVAVPGSSNSRIARRAFIDIQQHRPERVIIVWSDPSRFEFTDYRDEPYGFNADALQLRGSSADFDDIPRSTKKALKVYYEHLSSYHSDLQKTLYHVATIKNLCDSLNIPCVQMWFRNACIDNALKRGLQTRRQATRDTLDEYIDYLENDPNIFLFNQERTFEALGHNLLCPWDDHPSEEAHVHAANWFKEYFE